MKEEKRYSEIRIPSGKFCEDRDCCRCVYAERSPGSNSGWYCDYKRTHVRPGRDECGYFRDSGRYK